jgi:hypothetical protein
VALSAWVRAVQASPGWLDDRPEAAPPQEHGPLDDTQRAPRVAGGVAPQRLGSLVWIEPPAVRELERGGDWGTERHVAWVATWRVVREGSASHHHITLDERHSVRPRVPKELRRSNVSVQQRLEGVKFIDPRASEGYK